MLILRRCVWIAVAVSSCAESGQQGTVIPEDPHVVELRDSLQWFSDSAEFNGFGVAIIKDNVVLFQGGFGMADRDALLPYTDSSTQTVGSISKTLIGLAVMKAVDQGKLELDDPVAKYLTFAVLDQNHPDIPITVRHLVTHTSSITDTEDAYLRRSYVLTDTSDLTRDLAIDISPARFSAPSTAVPMEVYLRDVLSADGRWYERETYTGQRPGERFEYSNIGATLAARVVEQATGQAFDTFTEEHILKPLGMRSSGWNTGSMDRTSMSQLYRSKLEPYPRYRLITYPDGGFVTSSADMAKYMIELLQGYRGEGSLLSKAAYAEYFRAQLSEANFDDRNDGPLSDEYNMGILMGFNPSGAFGHTGGDPGVTSMFFIDPTTGIGRYMIVNTDLKEFKPFRNVWEMLGRYAMKMDTQ